MIKPYKSHQEIFDIVAKHLLTQKEKSVDQGECLYRGNDGLKCAIGALFPDDVYHFDMEGVSAAGLATSFPKLTELFSNISLEFLDILQGVHDSYLPAQWKDQLHLVASDNGLDDTVLDQFN